MPALKPRFYKLDRSADVFIWESHLKLGGDLISQLRRCSAGRMSDRPLQLPL